MTGSTPRQHAATAASTLPLFPLLASHSPQTRTDAATRLIQALALSLSDPRQDPDTPYTLKRLVTGLASSNEAARQGFAVALAQLVQSLPEDSDAATVLPALIEATTSKAGMDAREERDLLFARLMGLHALVRSGVLVRAEGEASSAGENWKEVVLALVSLANKKTWIREPAYWVVCDALRALLEVDDTVAWKNETVQWAVQRLLGDAREKARGWSPEKVAIVLVLQSHGVDADFATLLAPTFPSGSLLARSSLSTLANALKGSLSSSSSLDSPAGPSQGSNAVKTSKGASAPAPGQAPHFVWQLLCDAYFPPSSTSSAPIADRAPFNAFWTACVDTPLFGSSSHPLKALGFNLIQLFLPRLSSPSTEIQTLFGPNALRVLHNHLKRDSAPASAAAGGGKTLAKVAEKLVGSTLPSYLSQHPEATLPVLKALVSEPNSQYNAFETKVLEKIVVKLPLSAGGVRGWVAYLRSVVLSPSLLGSDVEDEQAKEDEDKVVAAQRNWAFDQMLFIVRNASVEKDDELVKGLLQFLAVVGWFEVRKEGGKGARSYTPTRPLTASHRLSARSRFFSILSALVSAPAPLGGPAWLARALGVLDALEADSKHFARAEAEDEEEEEKEGLERLKALDASLSQSPKAGEEKELLRRATARALLEGVRLVVWDEGADEAGDVIEGAVDAVEALFPSLATSSPSDDEDTQGEEPEPATILLDTLLTLLRRPSAFVKSFVGPIVLRGFADEVGEQGVELVSGVVAPEEEEEGEDEEVGEEGEKEVGEDEDDEESGDEDDDEDDEDDGLEVDEAFKQELLAALEAGGMAVPNAASDDEDEEMQDGEGESEEEELLDDDAMLELDERLADIFRANGGGRRSKKRDRQDDLHYRLRCLDLLDVLAHAKPASPLLTPLFVPLFNLIRTASSAVESELQTKAGKLLRFLVQPRKAASPADSVDASASTQTALDALNALHKAAANVDDVSLAPLCAQVGVALVKTVAALSPSTAQADVSPIYLASFEKYLTTKNAKTRVQPALTLEAAKRAPVALWGMVGRVVELAAGEVEKVNAFRRMQAFEVVQALVTAYANLKTPESKSGVLSALPPYRDALYSALSSSLSSSTASPDFDIARLKLLAKQALAVARLTVQISSQSTAAQLWKADEWAKLIDVAKENERFKGAVGVQTLVKQLVGVLGASVTENTAPGKAGKKEKKRKAGAAEKVNEGTPAKKVKQDKAAVPAPLAAAPENEVQDESVEAAEGAEVETATPSKKRAARGVESAHLYEMRHAQFP